MLVHRKRVQKKKLKLLLPPSKVKKISKEERAKDYFRRKSYLRKFRLIKRFIFVFLKHFNPSTLTPKLFLISYRYKKNKKRLRRFLRRRIARFFLSHFASPQNRKFRLLAARVRIINKSTLFPYRFFRKHKRGIRRLFEFPIGIRKKRRAFVQDPQSSKKSFYVWLRRRRKWFNEVSRKKVNLGYKLTKFGIGNKRAAKRIRYWVRRRFRRRFRYKIARIIRILAYIRAYRKVTTKKKPGWGFLPRGVRKSYRRLALLTFRNQPRRKRRLRHIRYQYPYGVIAASKIRRFYRRRTSRVKRVVELIFSNHYPRRPRLSIKFRRRSLRASFLKPKRKFLLTSKRSRPALFFKPSKVINSTRRVPRKNFAFIFNANKFRNKYITYSRASKFSSIVFRFFRRKLPFWKRKKVSAKLAKRVANKIHFFWQRRSQVRRKFRRRFNNFIRKRYAAYHPFLGVFRRYGRSRYRYKSRRRKFFRYFGKLFAKKSFRYGLNKFRRKRNLDPKANAFFIHIFRSVNNLFVNFSTKLGRSIFVYSSGRGFFKGSKRLSPIAAESMGKHVSSLVKASKVKEVGVVFHTRLDYLTKALLRGLKPNVNFTSFKYRLMKPHNGLRKPASRRV
jgi:ribosomal protein S11